MKYQKIINFLDNKPNQTTKFRTKNCVEINEESRGMYNKNNQIRSKTSMLRSACNYSDAYILVKGTIIVAKEIDAAANNANKKVIFKNFAPFVSFISRINNIGDVQYIDVITPIHKLKEYRLLKNIWNFMAIL